MDALQTLVAVALIAVAVWALVVFLVWRLAPSKATALDLVRLLPDVLRLAAGLARDPSTPRSCRIALAGLAIWIASPIDLIPEFIPVAGPLDDIVVAAIVLRWVGRRVGEEPLRAHWPGSPEGFELVRRLLGSAARAA
jgi:uncharacterized membrane protein YkvA (DUF1232 family)